MAIVTAIRNNALALGLFAVLTAGAIALTQSATREAIADNREQARAKALFQIVPTTAHDNDLVRDRYTLNRTQRLGYQGPVEVYRARTDGQIHTVILPAIAPDGYTGNIDLIVGVKRDGSVAGVRILRHQETPGLGDKVDVKKSDWVLSFNDQRLNGEDDPDWAVKKDGGRFDQFTGATITPRAVVGAVKQAVLTFEANRAALLEDTPLSSAEESIKKTTAGDANG
ncbi:electron transport complex subunit RsxG [Motiliproteus sp.]|uniref:electron transport complex subunit RsxG n=1 Tax=Motiliproteus sp. TaxID=1898955 RepID=UPI003BACEC9F